jgi:hypothetical protein
VNRELQGDTLVVRIPMRFRRQGGRKRIVAPDGSDLAPPTRAQPDGTLVKALARAWRWQRQLDAGVYSSLAVIAAAEKLSPSYVSRIAGGASAAQWREESVHIRDQPPLPIGLARSSVARAGLIFCRLHWTALGKCCDCAHQIPSR